MNIMRRVAMWSVLYYIRWWAKLALLIGGPVTIGIAGSVGKSSTKEVLLAMLTQPAKPRATYGNSETGVPLGILNLEAGDGSVLTWLRILASCPFKIFSLRSVSHLIVEMATDEPYPPKNMDYLLSIVKPRYSLLLNTFPVHTMQFAEALKEVPAADLAEWSDEQKQDFIIERLAEEDAKIITNNPGTIGIYNADDRLVGQQILSYLSEEPLASTYSFGQEADNDIHYGDYHVSPSGSRFSLIVDNQPHDAVINNYLLPVQYREVLAAALLAGIKNGFKLEDLLDSLSRHLHLPKGRASLLKGVKESIIIDSSYNASGAAVTAMLTMLAELKQQTKRPAVVVLGDMREIGLAEQVEHETVAQAVGQVADRVYLVGSLTEQYVKPWLAAHQPNLTVEWFKNYADLNNSINGSLPDQSLVLVKGSQNTIFLEETVKVLLADSREAQRLCRQEDYWLQRKAAWLAKAETAIKAV